MPLEDDPSAIALKGCILEAKGLKVYISPNYCHAV